MIFIFATLPILNLHQKIYLTELCFRILHGNKCRINNNGQIHMEDYIIIKDDSVVCGKPPWRHNSLGCILG